MTYRLYGALGSPYSIKMRALLRYRRIPHVWVQGRRGMELAQTRMKAPVIPVLEYPDGTLANDSTPLIHDLETKHTARSVIPPDPGDAFLAALIEDMADEWMTKWMFHYRWFRPRDQETMSRWLAYDSLPGAGLETIGSFAAAFRDRQVSRMALVGCTPANQPLIEGTAETFLAALDAEAVRRPFLFGARPSLAEFAIHGQLSQLAIDPTPSDMMRARFPYALRWVENLHDLSGLEGDWDAPHAPVSPPPISPLPISPLPISPLLRALLALAGEVYLPFLAANAQAAAAGETMMAFSARGCTYEQGVFRYQVKCLATLRAGFAAVPAPAKARIAPLLEEAGALALLAAS